MGSFNHCTHATKILTYWNGVEVELNVSKFGAVIGSDRKIRHKGGMQLLAPKKTFWDGVMCAAVIIGNYLLSTARLTPPKGNPFFYMFISSAVTWLHRWWWRHFFSLDHQTQLIDSFNIFTLKLKIFSPVLILEMQFKITMRNVQQYPHFKFSIPFSKLAILNPRLCASWPLI